MKHNTILRWARRLMTFAEITMLLHFWCLKKAILLIQKRRWTKLLCPRLLTHTTGLCVGKGEPLYRLGTREYKRECFWCTFRKASVFLRRRSVKIWGKSTLAFMTAIQGELTLQQREVASIHEWHRESSRNADDLNLHPIHWTRYAITPTKLTQPQPNGSALVFGLFAFS